MTELTHALTRDEDSLEDHDGTGLLEDFAVTLRIHDSVTPEPADPGGTRGATGLMSLMRGFTGGGGGGSSEYRGDDVIPCIAVIPPLTPPGSGTVSPDGHSTVSLNSSVGGSPLYQRKDITVHDNNGAFCNGGNNVDPISWRSESPLPAQSETEAKDFFAYRDSILNHVVSEVQKGIDTSENGDIKGTWLLTEIDFWNHEWERLVVLCDKAVVIFKYDFIGMKVEDMRRLDLGVIDKVIQGELAYPQKSLTPKINGIAEGIAGVLKDYIVPTVHGTVQTVSGVVWRKSRCGQPEQAVEATEDPEKYLPPTPSESVPGEIGNGATNDKSIKGSIMSILSLEKFEAKPRNAHGIQMIWNEHEQLTLYQKWNPFDKSIPRVTFTCHPLFWHKGGGDSVGLFDVDSFAREFVQVLSHGEGDLSPCCRIEYKPIVIESYVGIASLLHNANSLGFYKVRGKVSF